MNTSAVRPAFASTGSRLVALIVDGMVMGAITGLLYSLIGNLPQEGLITFLLTMGYQAYFLTHYQGQTPGKMLLGIRVVKTDGSPLTSSDAVVRTLGYTLNWITLGIGWWMAFGDEHHQGLHDRLANTYVVEK